MTTMTTTATKESTMTDLSTVTTIAEGVELSADDRATLLAVADELLRGEDGAAEIRPYVAGEHGTPVQLSRPLAVVQQVGIPETDQADGYLLHLTGARYAEHGDQEPHPAVEIIRRRGIKGPDGMKTVPSWPDVLVAGAHVVAMAEPHRGVPRTLPSGIRAGRLDLTVRVVIGAKSVGQVRPVEPPDEIPYVHTPARNEVSVAMRATPRRR